MSRRSTLPFGQLSRLQELAALESRRAVEEAVAETDQRTQSAEHQARQLARAEADFVALHAEDALCPARLALSGALLTASEQALRREQGALASAQEAETLASTEWLLDLHRKDWFADRAREQAKIAQRGRDAKAEESARSLRIAQKEGRTA